MKLKVEAELIIILGGSPTRVPTPPMLDKTTSSIKIGKAVIPKISLTSKVTGATRSTVVTLSIIIETKAVIKPRATINFQGSPFANLAPLMARYLKKPVFLKITTMVIIPNKSPNVSKSMASRACC